MSFSNQARINAAFDVLLAGVLGSSSSAWFEKNIYVDMMVDGDMVLDANDLSTVRGYPAGTLTQARTNAAAIPTLIEDKSLVTDALRLTEVPGTNGQVWAAYSTYGDLTSARYKRFLQPQMIPKSDGTPSAGYVTRVYEGDPNSGGTEITTTDGITGTGENKSVTWVWHNGAGVLLVAPDFVSSITNPYITYFRYIGKTIMDTLSPWVNKTGVITASSTKIVDNFLMSSFHSAKYILTVWNDTQGATRSVEGMVMKFGTSIRETVYAKLHNGAKIGFDTVVNGGDFELHIENKESYDLNYELYRLKSG